MINMKKQLIIIIGIIVLILFVTVLLSSRGEKSNRPVYHVALKVQLTKSDGQISLKDLDLQEIYPEKYETEFSKDYIEVRSLDKDNTVLTKGRLPSRQWLMIDSVDIKQAVPPVETEVESFLFFLPYYKETQKIEVLDDSGNILISKNLSDQKLREINFNQNLCGNGICDEGENVISCYSDCFYQPREFIRKIVP